MNWQKSVGGMLLLLVITANAAALPLGWRMDGTGKFPNATPPENWGMEQNVRWATPLPWSNSSPVLQGDRLFLCGEPTTLYCLDANDGKILWQQPTVYEDIVPAAEMAQLEKERTSLAPMIEKELALEEAIKEQDREARSLRNKKAGETQVREAESKLEQMEKDLAVLQEKMANAFPIAVKWRVPKSHRTNGYSPNTPCTDGKTVYAVFVTGMVGAYDVQTGERRWLQFFEKPDHHWGQSASPVLAGGTLIVQSHRTFGLDPRTGEIKWTLDYDRQYDHNWGTPAVFPLGDRQVILTDAGQIIDPATGTVLGQNRAMKTGMGSPYVEAGIAYCYDSRTIRAFRISPAPGGQAEIEELWKVDVANGRYYASPLLHEGLLYVFGPRCVLTVLEAATGEKVYEKRMDLKGQNYSTPVLAGNRIILSGESGQSVVIEPGREYREIARNELPTFRSTPIFAGNRMYLRTTDETSEENWVFCFEKGP